MGFQLSKQRENQSSRNKSVYPPSARFYSKKRTLNRDFSYQNILGISVASQSQQRNESSDNP